MKLWSMLQGKKTYIVALGMVLFGLWMGDNDLVFQGLAFAGLRNAL